MKIMTKILLIVLSIIGVVVIFSFLGNIAPTVKDSANDVYYPETNCTTLDSAGIKFSFNTTDEYCYNSTTNRQYPATITGRLPLAGLFSTSGLVLIMLMIIIFIVVIIYLKKTLWDKQ